VAGDAALLVDPTNTEELASAISRLLEDAQLREDLRQRGYERAEQFSWAASAQKMLAVYHRLHGEETIISR